MPLKCRGCGKIIVYIPRTNIIAERPRKKCEHCGKSNPVPQQSEIPKAEFEDVAKEQKKLAKTELKIKELCKQQERVCNRDIQHAFHCNYRQANYILKTGVKNHLLEEDFFSERVKFYKLNTKFHIHKKSMAPRLHGNFSITFPVSHIPVDYVPKKINRMTNWNQLCDETEEYSIEIQPRSIMFQPKNMIWFPSWKKMFEYSRTIASVLYETECQPFIQMGFVIGREGVAKPTHCGTNQIHSHSERNNVHYQDENEEDLLVEDTSPDQDEVDFDADDFANALKVGKERDEFRQEFSKIKMVVEGLCARTAKTQSTCTEFQTEFTNLKDKFEDLNLNEMELLTMLSSISTTMNNVVDRIDRMEPLKTQYHELKTIVNEIMKTTTLAFTDIKQKLTFARLI